MIRFLARKHAFSVASVLATGATALLCSAARADDCFDDWSAAAPLVRKEGLASVETLAELSRSKGVGALVRTQLCKVGEGFVYKLVIKDKGGQLRTLTIDARRPFER